AARVLRRPRPVGPDGGDREGPRAPWERRRRLSRGRARLHARRHRGLPPRRRARRLGAAARLLRAPPALIEGRPVPRPGPSRRGATARAARPWLAAPPPACAGPGGAGAPKPVPDPGAPGPPAV